MFEIEIKAHVDNPEKTKQTINCFGTYAGHLLKSDEYWKLEKNNSLTVRLRSETEFISKEKETIKNEKIFVTYKKKELQNSTEVNEELETEITAKRVLEEILKDAGFSIFRKKQKDVEKWFYENATLELCNVIGLGFFLEIEILIETDNKKIIEETKNKLFQILELAKIPKEKIETRYYTEMMCDLS